MKFFITTYRIEQWLRLETKRNFTGVYQLLAKNNNMNGQKYSPPCRLTFEWLNRPSYWWITKATTWLVLKWTISHDKQNWILHIELNPLLLFRVSSRWNISNIVYNLIKGDSKCKWSRNSLNRNMFLVFLYI